MVSCKILPLPACLTKDVLMYLICFNVVEEVAPRIGLVVPFCTISFASLICFLYICFVVCIYFDVSNK